MMGIGRVKKEGFFERDEEIELHGIVYEMGSPKCC